MKQTQKTPKINKKALNEFISNITHENDSSSVLNDIPFLMSHSPDHDEITKRYIGLAKEKEETAN